MGYYAVQNQTFSFIYAALLSFFKHFLFQSKILFTSLYMRFYRRSVKKVMKLIFLFFIWATLSNFNRRNEWTHSIHAYLSEFAFSWVFFLVKYAMWVECSTMARKTGVQDFKKWYLIPPCLTPSIIRYVSRVKWRNPGNRVTPSHRPQCCSYWKGSLRVALDYSHQL